MEIQQILEKTDHRPWNIPEHDWSYYQEWNDAIFLHWQVELEELKNFVPNNLEIDLFEGKPWVSIVVFKMEKIRPRRLPSFSPISDFDEINIRTYVKWKNISAVYFLSIEAGKRISAMVSKKLSLLPYRYSKIKRNEISLDSENIRLKEKLKFDYEIQDNISEKSSLEKWLTEKYALIQDSEKSLNFFEIHHLEWPLKEINLKHLEFNYPRFKKLINRQPNLAHYSKGVKVIAWNKIDLRKTGNNSD
ncbi:DUF2071 domain-containing protein [Gramella jeungdoensis]|uniref:DUF2071 domain-containing protein n=1 Tax=Gramella jeungdoensis TaxID=708091 RepID=A0ABT0YYZ2_9FLAO|nr:DUF2071 domain-containing protein [Gramella jeungdoensis]MCM8568554.1 DUF2071 domain-containing protein [Gramella jeungdoensis]